MEEMLRLSKEIEDYLEETYLCCRDGCGEDDDVCTIPAKKALDNIRELKKLIGNM